MKESQTDKKICTPILSAKMWNTVDIFQKALHLSPGAAETCISNTRCCSLSSVRAEASHLPTVSVVFSVNPRSPSESGPWDESRVRRELHESLAVPKGLLSPRAFSHPPQNLRPENRLIISNSKPLRAAWQQWHDTEGSTAAVAKMNSLWSPSLGRRRLRSLIWQHLAYSPTHQQC